jgi:hypothetical protein
LPECSTWWKSRKTAAKGRQRRQGKEGGDAGVVIELRAERFAEKLAIGEGFSHDFVMAVASGRRKEAGLKPGLYSGRRLCEMISSRSQDKMTLISLLKRLLLVLQRRSPDGQLWIVQPDRIRYRED